MPATDFAPHSRHRHSVWSLGMVLLSLAPLSAPTFAQTVPGATYLSSVMAGSEIGPATTCTPACQSSTPGTISSSGLNTYGAGNSTAVVRPSNDPTVAAEGTISAGPFGIATASADITYYFQVTGPVANVLVPIDITGKLTTTMIAYAGSTPGPATDLQSTASFQVSGNDIAGLGSADQLDVNSGVCNEYGGGCGVISTSTTMTVLSASGGTSDPRANGVFIVAQISGVSQPDGGYASSEVDPYFKIDPAFLAANPGYALVFSNGVGNAAPVPLPASAWLFLGGLAGLGALARRN